MEYLKDFDFQLLYHPGKANVVADALSRKKGENQLLQVARLWKMTADLVATNPVIQPTGFIANLVISNDLIERVKMGQVEDNELISLWRNQQISRWMMSGLLDLMGGYVFQRMRN